MRPIGLGKTLSEAVLLVRPTLSFLPSGLSAAPEAEPWHMLLPVLARTLWLDNRVLYLACLLCFCFSRWLLSPVPGRTVAPGVVGTPILR